jgi:hypothetical protein
MSILSIHYRNVITAWSEFAEALAKYHDDVVDAGIASNQSAKELNAARGKLHALGEEGPLLKRYW